MLLQSLQTQMLMLIQNEVYRKLRKQVELKPVDYFIIFMSNIFFKDKGYCFNII